MIKVAIVILNWNGKNFLEKFLPTVLKYTEKEKNYEVIVADNGSTDDSTFYLKEKFPEVKVIFLDKNYGFAGGYNIALAQIEAEYYILLNSDVEVTENWISPIIDFMDKNLEIGAVQPKILSYNKKEFFEYAGAAGGFIDKYGYPFCRGRIISEVEKDEGQYDDTKEIFWATGACMFVRAEVFKQIGGFDDNFFAHMEEIDLCWRMKNKNYKIFFFPGVKVYHVGGGSLSYESPFKLFLNYRNNLLLLYKNLHKSKTFSVIFIRLLLDGISALIFLLQGKVKNFLTVFKAHLNFYKLIAKFKAERKKLLPENKKTFPEIYKNSIVFDFFVRKKRKFTQLNFKNKNYE